MRRFHGFDARTRWARWGLLAIALGIVLGGTAPGAAQALADGVANHRDSLAWDVSRILAFGAYLAISGAVIYGLLLSTGILDSFAHRPISLTLHQDLSAVGIALGAVHAALLALDHSVPFTFAELAVPFASPYRPLWVGFGQLGLYLTVAVFGSFYMRRRIGQRAWRLVHYLSFLAFLGITAHTLATGTDSSLTLWLTAGAGAAVAFLLAYRVATAVTGGRRNAATSPGS